MRAAPDVILIGEIRDRETMEYAITFAGTGHLCLATLHANNAAETLDRIINMFPRDQHTQIFLDLSQYLKAILSQRLVMGKNGKRVAAIEVLLNTPHVQELSRRATWSGVKEALVHQHREGHAELRRGAVPALPGRQGHAGGGARRTPTRAPTSRPRSTSAEVWPERKCQAKREGSLPAREETCEPERPLSLCLMDRA